MRRRGGVRMQVLQEIARVLGLDPFEYLVITIGGVIVWTWCSVIGDFALTGRGIWVRWAALALAALGAVMFAYTARRLG
jgi:hypothetical protein